MTRKTLLVLTFSLLAVVALAPSVGTAEVSSAPDAGTFELAPPGTEPASEAVAMSPSQAAPEDVLGAERLAEGGRCWPCYTRSCVGGGGTCVERDNGKLCCEGSIFNPLRPFDGGESLATLDAFLGLSGSAGCSVR